MCRKFRRQPVTNHIFKSTKYFPREPFPREPFPPRRLCDQWCEPEAPEELPERGEGVEVRELVAGDELGEDAAVEVGGAADEVADLVLAEAALLEQELRHGLRRRVHRRGGRQRGVRGVLGPAALLLLRATGMNGGEINRGRRISNFGIPIHRTKKGRFRTCGYNPICSLLNGFGSNRHQGTTKTRLNCHARRTFSTVAGEGRKPDACRSSSPFFGSTLKCLMALSNMQLRDDFLCMEASRRESMV